MLLRETLRDTIQRLDPDGQDPELYRMVVIGHSQGGLLTKMTAIHGGTRIYDSAFRKPIQELDVSDQTRDLIRRVSFVEPLPFVERVIFIATPHRGSYLTLYRAAQWITRYITLPVSVVGAAAELAQDKDALVRPDTTTAGTSLDNMNPFNPFIQTLSAIPVAPGVRAHSIIPVEGDGPAKEGNDGVVKYTSAHIEGVESVLVIRSGHSVQARSEAIEEVRRILLLHAKENGGR
jgi:pimeloyl-ACP methyl ester carboxylesterase